MAKKDEHPAHLKQLHEHAPTVIHDPTANETILARWLRQGMEKGPLFWVTLGAVVLGAIALGLFVQNYSAGRSTESVAWQQLILASGAEKPVDVMVEVGKMSDAGAAAGWALMRAAESRYDTALADLPQNREAALPGLKEAHDLFKKAYDQASADSLRRHLAALGMARTLEARGDLEGAVQQYRAIVKDFPDTPEAARAEELVNLLRRPESRAFYEQFASFTPDEMTLPPRGTDIFNIPGLGGSTDPNFSIPGLPDLGTGTGGGGAAIPGLPDLGGGGASMPDLGGTPEATTPAPVPSLPIPDDPLSVPLPDVTTPETPAPETPAPASDLPGSVFAPETAPAPAPETAPAPAPSSDGELPSSPFADNP